MSCVCNVRHTGPCTPQEVTLLDTALENAAKAMYDDCGLRTKDIRGAVVPKWEDLDAEWQEEYRLKVRAALPFLRQALKEEMAQALEAEALNIDNSYGHASAWCECAAFLRRTE